MKKAILFGFFICLTVMGFSQSQRTVLLEEFTQASCPPCETTTPALNEIVGLNAEKIVQVRYQTSFPGVDPMNEDNPTEVAERRTFYQVDAVPTLLSDGTDTGAPGTITQVQIDAAHGMTSPVLIEVTHAINDLESMDVTVTITNESDIAFEDAADRLRVVLTEEQISWPTPPGSTSLIDFEAVMKTFFTGTDGMEIPEIAAGEAWVMTWSDLAIPSTVYDYNTLSVVAWLQNEDTKGIHNAAASEPITLTGYADLGITNAVANTSDDICDYEFSGEVTIENVGGLDVTSYDVNLVVNGEAAQTVTVTDVLAAGASNTVVFDPFAISAGNSEISYEVVAMGGDIATLNNGSQSVFVAKIGEPVEAIEIDFETEEVGTLTSSNLLDFPTLPITSGQIVNAEALGNAESEPAGSYGESENSVLINFYQWNPAEIEPEGSMVVAEQFIAADETATFSFDYAFTTWGGSNDRMQIQVSSDCGQTYTTVWDRAGLDLATAPELNTDPGFFSPTADEWLTESVDLGAFAGEDVVVRFFFTSGWGDMMYLDNINIKSVVNVNELEENETLSVFPNPTFDNINFELELNEPAEVSVKVLDLLGRTVLTQSVSSAKVSTVSHSISVDNLDSGAYLLYINAGDRVIVRNVSVIK